MDRVRKGELPWMNIDTLHRLILDEMLPQFGLDALSEPERDHLNRAWHRLDPWRDSVAGLTRLKRRFVIATLSNGNVALLTNMAKHAGLPWDCVLSAELFHHYKPDPESYLGAAAMLGVTPAQTMMVAAHEDDLIAARAVGLRTAFVRRPLEHGVRPGYDLPRERGFDYVADDFEHLASQLGV
jgi:2-haloacid dehalogenase